MKAEDWRSPDSRRNQILALKDAAKNLMPIAHSPKVPSNDSSGQNYLDQSKNEVQVLCNTLELTLLHGIKIREFQGIIPFWGLLERLEILGTAGPSNIALRNTVGAVACISSLRNPVGKFRAWIRQSLNNQNLDESIQFMLTQTTWLLKFYYPEAILCVKDDANILIAVLRSLKALPFNITVDDATLNELPIHLVRFIQQHTATNTAPSKSPVTIQRKNSGNNLNNANNNGGSGFSFDSFLKSFEVGFDKFVSNVDSLITTASSTKIVIPDSILNVVAEPETPNTAHANAGFDIKAMKTFFNSSLKDLVIDENRCQHAYLDPYLGIPNQSLRMINLLMNNVNTPNLFRQRANITLVEELKKLIEAEKPFNIKDPSIEDIAAISFLLIHWLMELPEPLFGYEHYHAIIACQDIENVKDRMRNLSILLREMPWYNKPTCLKVLALLKKCIATEEVMATNQLNLIAIAVLSTPFLLRPRPPRNSDYMGGGSPTSKRGGYTSGTVSAASMEEDCDAVQMTATAMGSNIISFIVNNYEEIFADVINELQQRTQTLQLKCQRVRTLQDELLLSLDVGTGAQRTYSISLSEEQIQLVQELWHLLKHAEDVIDISSRPVAADGESPREEKSMKSDGQNVKEFTMPFTDILLHPRWEKCGFVSNNKDGGVLTDFNKVHGYYALKSLVGFIQKYNEKAYKIISDFVLYRKQFCSFPVVLMKVTEIAAECLQLLPSAAYSTATVNNTAPISVLAKQPAWLLLNDDRCFQEFFDVSLLCFEEQWRNCTERIGEMPSTETLSQALYKTRANMWEIIVRRPATIKAVWDEWVSLRLAEEERLFNRKVFAQQQKMRDHDDSGSMILKHPHFPEPLPTATIVKDSKPTGEVSSKGSDKLLAREGSGSGKSTGSGGSFKRKLREGKIVIANDEDLEELSSDGDGSEEEFLEGFDKHQSEKDLDNLRGASNADEEFNAMLNDTIPKVNLPEPPSSLANPSKEEIDSYYNDIDVNEATDTFVNTPPRSTITAPRQSSKTAIHIDTRTRSRSSSNDRLMNPPSRSASLDLSHTSPASSAKVALQKELSIHEYGASTRSNAPIQGATSLFVANDVRNAKLAAEEIAAELAVVTRKTYGGIQTVIRGGSKILTDKHIMQLEAALPKTHQCYDWNLLYRMSIHGTNLRTLIHKAQGHSTTLLVIKDSNNAIFGAFITEQLRDGEKDKYYGGGTIGVWSFASGSLKYYPWSYKNSYFLISSRDCLALGGGGHFAIYLDGDLNRGSSGNCATYSSPCLAATEEFHCHSCELFALHTPVRG